MTDERIAQHTPGPWVAYFVTGPDRKPSDCFIDPPGQGRAIVRMNTYWPEWEANARLIAAAPELLEAAREVWLDSQMPSRCFEDNTWERCRENQKRLGAAIAKAEGRA